MDFVKSGCEKSWAEVQADSFSYECRGCAKMKELEVELEQLRLLVVAVVGSILDGYDKTFSGISFACVHSCFSDRLCWVARTAMGSGK